METVEYTAEIETPVVEEFMLTTEDNPYNPFTDYARWRKYDEDEMHYCTNGLFARFALTSNELTDEENEIEIERAADSIIKLFPGFYKKVWRDKK